MCIVNKNGNITITEINEVIADQRKIRLHTTKSDVSICKIKLLGLQTDVGDWEMIGFIDNLMMKVSNLEEDQCHKSHVRTGNSG